MMYIQAIRQKGGLGDSDAAELESHLADAVEDLRNSGLSEEEAFLVATRRLGQTDELSLEYQKVNPVLVTERIWAYMLLGFSLLTSLQWLYAGGSQLVMQYAAHHPGQLFLCIAFNLLVCAFVWSVLIWGRRFSAWLQRTTERRPWLTILLSLGPVAIMFRGPMVRVPGSSYEILYANGFFLFTHYLGIVSMAVVLLLSVFSISFPGRLTFRGLFSRLTAPYIVLFGFVIEIVAAMTRVWGDIPTASVLFGCVYATGAFCVACYPGRGQLLRALLLYALSGLVAETWAGTLADQARGHTHYTVYFVLAIVVGTVMGTVAARATGRFREVAAA